MWPSGSSYHLTDKHKCRFDITVSVGHNNIDQGKVAERGVFSGTTVVLVDECAHFSSLKYCKITKFNLFSEDVSITVGI